MHPHGGDVASSESMDKPGFSIGVLSQDERVPVRRLKKASYLAAMSGLPPLATELRRSLVARLVPISEVITSREDSISRASPPPEARRSFDCTGPMSGGQPRGLLIRHLLECVFRTSAFTWLGVSVATHGLCTPDQSTTRGSNKQALLLLSRGQSEVVVRLCILCCSLLCAAHRSINEG